MAAAAKKADPPFSNRPPGLVPSEHEPDTLIAIWPTIRVRFMFNDGTTKDVITNRDDSVLRGELLRLLDKEQIVGSTSLG